MKTIFSKEKYLQLCSEEHNIPLFMQPWWLDAVCAGKQWQAMVTTADSDVVVAAMVVMVDKCLGMTYATLPTLCYDTCVWLHEGYADDEMFVAELIHSFEERLQEQKFAFVKLLFGSNSVMPKQMKTMGYSVKLRAAYSILDTTVLDSMLANYSKSAKRELQQSLTLQVNREIEAEAFYQQYADGYVSHGEKVPYSRESFLVLYQKASRLGKSELLTIENQQGECKASAMLIWDEQMLYVLFSYFSEDAQAAGAKALLWWEAQKTASKKQLKFNFCTPWKRKKASVARQYGGNLAYTQQVSKVYNKWFWLVRPFIG